MWDIEAVGSVGTGPANVDWFRFTLASAADVTLTTPPDGPNAVVPVLTLFNDAPLNPNDSTQNDPYAPTGHRLLAQDDGAALHGVATVEQVLAPGTYFVAVSGSGDHDFNPLVAGSGEPGGTGNFGLRISGRPLALPVGPAVIAATPSDGAALSDSPLALRLALSSHLDPATVQPGVNVVLLDGNGNSVPLQQYPTSGAVFNPGANELQVFPAGPLAPGTYRLLLIGATHAGDAYAGVSPIRGTNGEALGSTTAGGPGQDYSLTFQVTGVDGVAGVSAADDTFGTARDLGDVPSTGLVQLRGTIGDDPFAVAPGADVDLYHFRVTGTGHFALVAGADAGRIGSPLQPALALFQVVNGQVTLLASDVGTGNPTRATDGTTPLTADSVLYAGLTAGDYYLAVGGAYNLPDPALGIPYPTPGFYDPTQTESGTVALSTGDYLLSLSLTADNAAPHVTAVDGLPSSTPGMPPTFITVHFDKPVNVRQLGFQQDQPAEPGTVSAVWVQGSDGVAYHPRLLSYDDTTYVATFYMLDALPDGPSALYLSGATQPDGTPGLTDLAGNLIAGSDANGNYVVPFVVNGPTRAISPATGHLTWHAQGANTSRSRPQVIGPLFPNELGNVGGGVDLLGHLTPATTGAGADPVDYYEIQLLQNRVYAFTLTDQVPPQRGHGATPTGTRVRVFTLDGHEITTNSASPFAFDFPLPAGTYVVEVGPLDPSIRSTDLNYRLRIALGTSLENAVALTTGAAPPYAIALQRGGSSGTSPGSPSSSSPAPPATTLTLPSAPGTDGVAPATGVATSAPGGAPQLSLPSGALTGLSAPPVGGVGTDGPGAPVAVTQLSLPGSSSAAAPGGVQLAALSPSSAAADTASGGADGLGAAISQLLRALDRLGGAAVDGVFHGGTVGGWLGSWLRGLHMPLTLPDVPAPAAETVPVPDDVSPDDEACDAPGARQERPLEAPDWLWASGMLAAGGLVAAPALQERRRAAAARRRPHPRLR
jgi:hypothetical protein